MAAATHGAARMEPWQAFVLEHGFRAPLPHLAHLLGQPEQNIARLRATGAVRRLAQPKPYGELFALWHGRSPSDNEWPRPRQWAGRGEYEWLPPELALLASLVGQVDVHNIAATLTARLQGLTGDPSAKRTRQAVVVRMQRIGLQTSDVVGGITTTQAAKEIGSLATVQQAIDSKQLAARRVGRLWVIPHEAWAKWKEGRTFPPKGFVLPASLREPLAIRSDKLSEFARMGYVPTAVRCNPYGRGPNAQFGTWYIAPAAAKELLAARRAGKPMPWHGKPLMDNLKVTFKLWEERRHPKDCQTCASIWGKPGAPVDFDDYVRRYPSLAHGAKRHLTLPWTPGLTVEQVAKQARRTRSEVLRATRNGALAFTQHKGRKYVTQTDATRWIARHCPSGDGARSWVSLETARKLYLFTLAELRTHIAQGRLQAKTGTAGAMRGIEYVSRQQCAQIREKEGFTHEAAARRLGITVARLRPLLAGVQWREAPLIPLATVQAVKKRLESREGHDVQEAAAALGVPPQWVEDRINDGTVRVSRAKWDRRRRYLTAPMLERLRTALAAGETGAPESGNSDLGLGKAALDAGVSAATLVRWAEAGEVARYETPRGWRYPRQSLRARARSYWANVRFHRAQPPAWLTADRSTG